MRAASKHKNNKIYRKTTHKHKNTKVQKTTRKHKTQCGWYSYPRECRSKLKRSSRESALWKSPTPPYFGVVIYIPSCHRCRSELKRSSRESALWKSPTPPYFGVVLYIPSWHRYADCEKCKLKRKRT